MKECFKCKRRATTHEERFECSVPTCGNWIHVNCLKVDERTEDYVNSWRCFLHKSEPMFSGKIFDESSIVLTDSISRNNMSENNCVACKESLEGQVIFVCYACEDEYHEECLSVEEAATKERNKNEFLCDDCDKIQQKVQKRKSRSNTENVLHTGNNKDNVFAEKALEYFDKQAVNKLPEVVDTDMSWTVFYEAFSNTHSKFKDTENIIRIQAAIKHPEIKRIGGKGLFNVKTYKRCIENINERLKLNLNSISQDAKEISKFPKIKSDQTSKLIEFIDKIRNFNFLAEAYNDLSYINNKMFINEIAEKIPNFLKNKWIDKQFEVESHNFSVKLCHMVEVLDKELPKLELRLRNDRLKLSKELKPNFSSKYNEKNRFNNTQSEVENKFDRFKTKKFNGIFCWYHKNNSHPSNKCRDLWKLDGKSVSQLAKERNRCTFCGQEKHFPCPFNKNMKCTVQSCGKRHHALYCFKRRISKTDDDEKNINTHTREFQNVENLNQHQSYSEKDETKNNNNTNNYSDRSSEDERKNEERFNLIKNEGLFSRTSNQFQEFQKENKMFTFYAIRSDESQESHCTKQESSINSCSEILPVVVIKLEDKVNAAFLLDTGSTVSMIEEKLANELKLIGPWFPLSLRWSGDKTRKDNCSRVVKVNCTKLISEKKKEFSLYFRTMLDLNVSSQTFVAKEFLSKYPYLKELQLIDHNEICGVIGIDNLWVFQQLKLFKPKSHKNNEPFGIKSPIGDYVMGTVWPLEKIYYELNDEMQGESRNNYMHSDLSASEIKELREMDEEVTGAEYYLPRENDRKIHEDDIATRKLEKEVKRIKGTNHFTAPLLFKNDNVVLPTKKSYDLALKRYKLIEKHATKLNRFDECVNQIKNLIDKNYAVELNEDEIKTMTNKTYYNPIFFIFPKNKRMRMIWDLAAKIDGSSINDELLAGPNLYNNLLQIIFQMCEQQYLVKGDVMEMFHQIRINEEDTEALRFMFRFPGEEKIRIFKMLVLPFGAKCSPTISQFVKNLVAKEYLQIFPEAADLILNSTYVDDIVHSNNCLEKAKQLPLEAKIILEKGGFTLLKINSNEQAVVDHLKSSLCEEYKKQERLFSEETNEKLLGYTVNFQRDTISLTFSFDKLSKKILNGSEKPNKRQILQLLMSIFDPVGYLQFITSKLKLVYHKVCMEKYDWNQIIDDKLFAEWKRCLDWLESSKNIEIPRYYNFEGKEIAIRQLWAFADAGKDMLCAVHYIRFLDSNRKQVGYRLIYAKTFLAPYKQCRTIPELELDAALKNCKMVKTVRDMHKLKFDETFLITDNAAVYEWIRRNPKKPTIYVKNRIDKIHHLSKESDWLWMPTKFMPADFGTKESSIPEIKFENDWFHPKIFEVPEDQWPRTEPNESVNLNTHVDEDEIRENGTNTIFDPTRHKTFLSYFYSIQCAYRWLHLYKNNNLLDEISELEHKKKSDMHNRQLRMDIKKLREKYYEERLKISSVDFMYDKIEKLMIRNAQLDEYRDEVRILEKKQKLPTKNRLFKLSPWLDKDNILRGITRLTYNEENLRKFGYDRIFPIILPKMHRFTELVVLKYHEENVHMCSNNVIGNIIVKYYIPHIRWVVKQIISKCAFCNRYNARPAIPMMGDLPSYRLAVFEDPFTYSIADIAGPIKVVNARNVLEKRYILVYSCLTTRALHLELIQRLDSNSTLLAFQNIFILRGAPKRIVCDNGTNFVGASSIIHKKHEEWNKKLLTKGIIRKPVEFDFGPARASHMQGSVERMVGLVKTAIKHVNNMMMNKRGHYDDFTLKSILLEVVGIMNNRPLALNNSIEAFTDFITPNSFLMLRPNYQEVPARNRDSTSIEKHWEDIRELSAIIWEKWLVSYLPEILKREKWINKVEPLQVGDIVVTADPSVSNSWRLAKILDTKLGSKDQVREVVLLLGKKDTLKNVTVSKKGITNINKKEIMRMYRKESSSIVTRPALGVAKINL